MCTNFLCYLLLGMWGWWTHNRGKESGWEGGGKSTALPVLLSHLSHGIGMTRQLARCGFKHLLMAQFMCSTSIRTQRQMKTRRWRHAGTYSRSTPADNEPARAQLVCHHRQWKSTSTPRSGGNPFTDWRKPRSSLEQSWRLRVVLSNIRSTLLANENLAGHAENGVFVHTAFLTPTRRTLTPRSLAPSEP